LIGSIASATGWFLGPLQNVFGVPFVVIILGIWVGVWLTNVGIRTYHQRKQQAQPIAPPPLPGTKVAQTTNSQEHLYQLTMGIGIGLMLMVWGYGYWLQMSVAGALTIRGVVLIETLGDITGRPIEGIEIEISYNKATYATKTEKDGKFEAFFERDVTKNVINLTVQLRNGKVESFQEIVPRPSWMAWRNHATYTIPSPLYLQSLP
jgi:hypothetical protein